MSKNPKDAVPSAGEPRVSPTSLTLDEATTHELRRLQQTLNERSAELGALVVEKSLLQEREEASVQAVKRAREDLTRAMEQTLRLTGASAEPNAQWNFRLEQMPAVVERVR